MHLDTFRTHTRLIAVAVMLAFAATAYAVALEPIEIGDRNQVFIDGRYLAQSDNVRIVVCPPRKTNEKCLVGKLGGYSSLLKADPAFRWYSGLTKDGIHWRRVSGFNRPEADDILGVLFGGTCVFADPKAPPSQRYKRFNGLKNTLSASSDGSDWKPFAQGMFPAEACYPHGMDSHNVCFHDTRLDKYVAYTRVNKVYTCPPERVAYFQKIGQQRYGGKNKYARRTIGRSVTDDLTKFPAPDVVLEPDEKDPIFGGVKAMDFYCPQVVQYEHAQDAYFLFNCRYRSIEDWYLPDDMSQYPRSESTGVYNVGIEDIELAASRDGITWHRYDRRAWIRLGPKGSFDSLNMYMTRGMHLAGDQIWMYYMGLDDPHTGNKEAQKRYTLSRVIVRKDGFTCVEAPYEGGQFTTPGLRFAGDTLLLNIETSGMGLARVEIQDGGGKPISGFGLEDCDRIHAANSTKHMVTWRGKSDLASLAGTPIRLRFELQFGTRLFAFRFDGREND
jgi:hypothetical protein